MNPEVALGESYNETTEVYALGCLCYELLTLKRPYRTINDMGNNDKNKNCIAEGSRRSGKTKSEQQCGRGVCHHHKSHDKDNNNDNDGPLFNFVIVQMVIGQKIIHAFQRNIVNMSSTVLGLD